MYMIAAGDGCCISCPIKTNLMCLQHKKYFCSKCILFKWNEKNVRARFKLRLQVFKGTYPRQYHITCEFDVKRLLNMLFGNNK